jgi:hypothetical protein
MHRLLVLSQWGLENLPILVAYIRSYIHPYIHTSIHIYIPTYLHAYIPTYLHACMYCMHACIHTDTHALIIVYVYFADGQHFVPLRLRASIGRGFTSIKGLCDRLMLRKLKGNCWLSWLIGSAGPSSVTGHITGSHADPDYPAGDTVFARLEG